MAICGDVRMCCNLRGLDFTFILGIDVGRDRRTVCRGGHSGAITTQSAKSTVVPIRPIAGKGGEPSCPRNNVLSSNHSHCRGNSRRWTRCATSQEALGAYVLGDEAASGSSTRVIQESVLTSDMDFLLELWAFLRIRKKLWLLPIIIIMVILGGLLVLAQGSVIAPFIYTLF